MDKRLLDKKVIVTGGLGFIGSAIARRLSDVAHVTIIDSLIPSTRLILGVQPNFIILEMSSCFLGVPSGLELSQTIFPLNPIILCISLANSLIVKSLPVPTL